MTAIHNTFCKHILIISVVLSSSILFAQDSKTIITDYLDDHMQEMALQSSDVSEFVITNEYYSSSTKVTHVYINQSVNGIEIVNGLANFNIRNGEVFSMGDRLIRNLEDKTNGSSPSLSAVQAIQGASEQLGIELEESLTLLETISSSEFIFAKSGISLEEIPVKLVYQHTEDDMVRLSWDLSISMIDEPNWWSLRLDALTGEIISKNNWTVHCDFEVCGHEHHLKTTVNKTKVRPELPQEVNNPPVAGSYNVFAIPLESPAHGPRTIVTDPEDPIASPDGWHVVSGATTQEFTITRGNNVHSYEDISDNDVAGEAPDGGAALSFDFPYDGEEPAVNSLDAATTNLFYMNNIMHDVWYHYGFDEASGNFQATNFTGTGGQGNDYVRAEAQDGSGVSNANFSTPNDGSRPRMQMYLWTDVAASNFTVNSPPSSAVLDIEYLNSIAGFGPDIPSTPITADLVLVTDDMGGDSFDACETIVNADELDGKIAVIRRGECEFGFKVLAAENEGAVAVIIVNNVSGDPITMGAGDVGNQVNIPSIMLSSAQGQPIMNALEDGDVVNGTIVDDSAGLIAFDSSFDNGIIAHEYGHGISNRLTGGGNNTNCLNNDEQMGEGWSDWFGLMLTMYEDDQPGDPRGIGTYVIGQPNDGNGIRPAPYSTSPSINSFTYAATNNDNLTSQPHGIGFVWATMLWDMTWDLIDIYGYDPDVYYGAGGNNIAMQLVVDGLKLQACGPGFVDGRDAILEADVLNYDGAHQCLIWNAFANRGLGYSADQGSPNSRTDQTQAFDTPPVIVSVDVDLSTLTANYSNADVTYQWYDCSDNSEIPGATEQSIAIEGDDEYFVEITQNGCAATSGCVGLDFVGLEDLISSNVGISPNPAREFLMVDLGDLEDVQTLELIDLQGRTVYSEGNLTNNVLRIDLNSISAGLYMLQVSTESATSSFKVVVE